MRYIEWAKYLCQAQGMYHKVGPDIMLIKKSYVQWPNLTLYVKNYKCIIEWAKNI
jgi:hypothetical protein